MSCSDHMYVTRKEYYGSSLQACSTSRTHLFSSQAQNTKSETTDELFIHHPGTQTTPCEPSGPSPTRNLWRLTCATRVDILKNRGLAPWGLSRSPLILSPGRRYLVPASRRSPCGRCRVNLGPVGRHLDCRRNKAPIGLMLSRTVTGRGERRKVAPRGGVAARGLESFMFVGCLALTRTPHIRMGARTYPPTSVIWHTLQ